MIIVFKYNIHKYNMDDRTFNGILFVMIFYIFLCFFLYICYAESYNSYDNLIDIELEPVQEYENEPQEIIPENDSVFI